MRALGHGLLTLLSAVVAALFWIVAAELALAVTGVDPIDFDTPRGFGVLALFAVPCSYMQRSIAFGFDFADARPVAIFAATGFCGGPARRRLARRIG